MALTTWWTSQDSVGWEEGKIVGLEAGSLLEGGRPQRWLGR